MNSRNLSLILVSSNKAPDVLKADETLVIRKAGKGNDPVLMKKDSYCNTIVMKHHPNTRTYEKVNSNSDIRIVSNLKSLVKNYESFLTKNESIFLSSNSKSSNHLKNFPERSEEKI